MYNLFLGELSREQIVAQMLEITLVKPDYFLVVRETLTRMGIPSSVGNRLYQSCHIFQKKGKYYIVHFKEMLAMDGLNVTMSQEDLLRRDNIAHKLQEWKLIQIVDPIQKDRIPQVDNKLMIVHYSDSPNWTKIPKYTMGKKINKGDKNAG